jgi:sec-independent protein translocase protein TatB
LLSLVGLIVLGPERLPAVARTLGGLMRKARASWASLRSTIESELAEADIAKPIKEVGDELRQMGKDLKQDLPDMNSILKPESKPSTKPQADVDTDAESDTETVKAEDLHKDQPTTAPASK